MTAGHARGPAWSALAWLAAAGIAGGYAYLNAPSLAPVELRLRFDRPQTYRAHLVPSGTSYYEFGVRFDARGASGDSREPSDPLVQELQKRVRRYVSVTVDGVPPDPDGPISGERYDVYLGSAVVRRCTVRVNVLHADPELRRRRPRLVIVSAGALDLARYDGRPNFDWAPTIALATFAGLLTLAAMVCLRSASARLRGRRHVKW